MARRVDDQSSGGRVAPMSGQRRLELECELRLVGSRWRADDAHSGQTRARSYETAKRFAARLNASGVSSFAEVTPAMAREFVIAPTAGGSLPQLATQHARRTALRMTYKTLRDLGLCVGDPTLDLVLPPRGSRVARPLTDDEVVMCRVMAQSGQRTGPSVRCAAWALGEATAVSSEITQIKVSDLDDPRRPLLVRLPGTRRHDPRVASLTSWGSKVLAERAASLTTVGPDALLAYGGAAPPGGAKAQASVSNALRAVLDLAGLARESDVRPSSLRHWAGRVAYDAGARIDQVALMLGHRSLDETATDIGLDWRDPEEAK